jgi:hypothetical protein
MKLTATLRKHPKKTFMYQTRMLKLLQTNKATVAINPQPKDEIIEDMPYEQYLKSQTKQL